MTFKLSSSIFEGDSARAEEFPSARLAGEKGRLCVVAAMKGEARRFCARTRSKTKFRSMSPDVQ